jgi:hypothetical protein
VIGEYHSPSIKDGNGKYISDDFFYKNAKDSNVDVSLLRPTHFYVEKEKIELMLRNTSIISNGNAPIEVIKKGNDYFVWEGHHRVFTAKLLKIKRVKVKLLEV